MREPVWSSEWPELLTPSYRHTSAMCWCQSTLSVIVSLIRRPPPPAAADNTQLESTQTKSSIRTVGATVSKCLHTYLQLPNLRSTT
jgi:hypothetical protein